MIKAQFKPNSQDSYWLSLRKRVEDQQSKMHRSTTDRNFDIGDCVTIRDYRSGRDTWIPGKINMKTGPVSYRVEIAPGVSWRRHADQIRRSELVPEPDRVVHDSSYLPLSDSVNSFSSASKSFSSQSTTSQSTASQSSTRSAKVEQTTVNQQQPPKNTVSTEKRYPTKIRKKVEKLNL
ncbi:uncharacterized protein LOC128553501 [Mercenaria mercenaria]|uniref:uncharacterized protein LOC128553501 n=1 Tax=Mercenaria mercenaria TaxID=6596 RepID=UPI00234F4585|nr:uncharacterized protein LOC128553501 [Mercenaria mercenaria]